MKFGDFDVKRKLGKGSYGHVYKVIKMDTKQIFALKKQNKEDLEDDDMTGYAVREVAIMKKLDHPFIVKLVSSFQTPENLYMVLEYCENGNLYEFLKLWFESKNCPLDEKVAKFVIAELVLAMKQVHDKGVLFRDLKLENILLDSEGHMRLADFGLSKRIEEVQSEPKYYKCGSYPYIPPEMLAR